MCFCLIRLHKVQQIKRLPRLLLLPLLLATLAQRRKMDATEKGATLKQSNLCFLEYLCNIVLSDKIKSKSLVGIVPRIGHPI